MTYAEYAEKVLKPATEKFLAAQQQTEEEFLAECDQALAFHYMVMHWARTGEWVDA